MLITIFGSCRQDSIKKIFNCSDIQEEISYPHYTKEIIQIINYLKYNNLKEEEIINIFRTPILKKKNNLNYQKLKNQFDNTDIFILEIASKIYYKWENKYVHHIASEDKYNLPIKNKIIIDKLTKNEIENDIIMIKKELNNKPILIVSHLVTINSGDRYDLKNWLEEICKKYDILFLDPIKELKKNNTNIDNLFLKEKSLNHYNDKGHEKIKEIYKKYIVNFIK
jgi:hypothetical protein